MNSFPQISVIVPFYNEAGNVQPLVARILDALSPVSPLELILVDDGSTDNTWEQLQLACRADARVRAIRHPANLGQSAALFSGFRVGRGHVLATLDGDLQNDPVDLPRMLAELDHCDMVCGVRTIRADGMLRRLSSRVARWTRKLVLNVDFADSGCNLRVFKRHLVATFPAFKGVHRFIPILASSAGAVVKEMPVSHHPRHAGHSKYGIGNRLGVGILDLVMVAIFIRRHIEFDVQAQDENPAPESHDIHELRTNALSSK